MALYVITHKYLEKPVKITGYRYLYVGAYRQQQRNSDYSFDDVGESISEKNANYCELTGLYWIWKNSRENNVGLAHYRRFFTHFSLSSSAKYYYSVDELDKILERYDLIVASKLYVAAPTIYDNYAQYHYAKDIDLLRTVIEEVAPSYLDAFDDVFKRNYYSPCNMFYSSKTLISEYCEWLFNILGEYENRIDISGYNAEQARIYGFLAERLFNIWIVKNKVRYKELPMIQTDCSYKHRVRLILDKVFKRAIRDQGKYNK